MRASLRLVIAVLCAVVVLIVASSTFAVSYSISLATVRDLGRTQTMGLARIARVQTENYFERPVQDIETLRKLFLQFGMDLPSRLPDQTDEHVASTVWNFVLSTLLRSNFSYSALGVILDDASGGAATVISNDTNVFAFQWRNVHNWPTGNMTGWEYRVNINTKQQVPANTIRDNLDSRFEAYNDSKPLARSSTVGFWVTETLYVQRNLAYFQYPAAASILDRNGDFIGVVIAAVGLDQLSVFLAEVKSAVAGTEAFLVDKKLELTGSSHAIPSKTIGEVPQGGRVPLGCISSAGTSFYSNTTFYGCLESATSFPYAPLRAAAAVDGGAFITSAAAEVRLLDADGEAFFVASTPVANLYRFFQLNVVLCVPEAVVLGDIVQGRNIVLGLTAAIFVVAAGASAALVTLMLQPLADVSQRMTQTAKLRETGPVSSLSAFTEIRGLQAAYGDMSLALQSFTRYVPRDVVKDLMATGELCQIAMAPRMCTMLFCDIAGFTTICERVPLDALSAIVTRFFERASTLVMRHGGLVDKFIGDCVMAVWGAPFAAANAEVKAVLAAKLLDWETRNAALGAEWDAAGEALCVRVGVATGQVLAGNMGSMERMNYTVIGDAVNLASRLEGLNKQFETQVMVDGATALALRHVFVLRLLLPIAVVGKAEAVRVYEIVGLAAGMLEGETGRMMQEEEHRIDAEKSTVTRATATTAADYRPPRQELSAVDLLMLAQKETAASAQPMVCPVGIEVSADRHTRAVERYLQQDYAGALELLRSGTDNLPGQSSRPNAAHELVQNLCEKYLRDPPTSEEFSGGVYKATQK